MAADPQAVLDRWLPTLLQAVVVVLAGWGFAQANEHRLTALEVNAKAQSELILQMSVQQKMMQEEIVDLEKTQEHLIDLEDFVHRRTHGEPTSR